VLVDATANETISSFMADKIRSRVHDPAIAEKLIPTNHGFGTRRVPLENGYYECYNEPNVRLVDLNETPVKTATATGIETTAEHHDLDLIVFATGFDAVTGPFEQIDLRGIGGTRLSESWQDGPRTYLGLLTAGFPNLFMPVGPHNAAAFCNIPRCIEHNVEWITDVLRHMRDAGCKKIDATEPAQEEWTAEVHALASRMLLSKTQSWFTGRNRANAAERGPTVLLYTGGFPTYQKRCGEVAAAGYGGLDLS
jgi:cation diffusion facilitator CzcD-associated flavoprotein CzcO